MSYPEARKPLPPHTRGEYYIYIHSFILFQSTDYYFQFSFQPSEQNIQVDWSLKITAVEHHWNQTSSLKLFHRSGNVFHIEFLIVRSRAAFWGSHCIWFENDFIMIAFYMLHFQECGGSGATRYSYSEQRRSVTSRQSLANCVYLLSVLLVLLLFLAFQASLAMFFHRSLRQLAF